MKAILLLALFFTAIAARADTIQIVAAENFYGGVASQIAGSGAKVISILSNPNQDPHEFTTDAATAKAVADADIVIYNGIGYDDWMDKLLSTGGKKDRVVIRVADLIGAKNGDNPHIWYDPLSMRQLAEHLADALKNKWPYFHSIKSTPFPFDQNVGIFLKSLQPIEDKISALQKKYGGTTVTATEPVFGYMATALGFKMLNYDFQVNIMNDTEPSAAQTAAFENSLKPKTVKILFYNKQVTDPTTERLKKLAIANDIPIVGVTETQPAEFKTYTDWIENELNAVDAALAHQAGSFPGSANPTP